MRAYHGHPSLSECWPPDLIAEPVARDVTIGVADSWRARIILPDRSPPRPVLSEGAPAMRTPATSGRVRTQRSMPIGPPTGIRRGAAQEVRVGQYSQHCSGVGMVKRRGSQSRSNCCLSRASAKTGSCRGPFHLALRKVPAGVCPVSRIGHPCGNLHRAGLTGRPLAGVPSDLRCSRMRFGKRDAPAARGTAARP
jgi:hypothetical protein